LIVVSSGRKQRLIELGIDAGQVEVLRNGVDLALFQPHHRDAARKPLGLTRPTLLAVGNLVALKRHRPMIEALAQSGFDDADRRERPGILAHALAIAHAFQTGAQVYDFRAGRNRLKESFATRCEPMLWQVVQQPRWCLDLEQLGLQIRRGLAHSVGPAARRLRRKIFPCKAHKDTAANVATELAGELRRRESGVLWRSL
jgi:hypothetical protein